MRQPHFFILLIFLLSLPVNVDGSSLKISPLKVSLGEGRRSAVLSLTNTGEEAITLQVSAKRWLQDETGKDIYSDTEDIIFFPRIFQIEKGKTRIIRVGYQGAVDVQVEKAYRLFIEELPVTAPRGEILRFVLRFAVPVFITPSREVRRPIIEKVGLAHGSVRVKIGNAGNTHLLMRKLVITGVGASGREVFSRETAGWYILEGSSRAFIVNITEQECLEADVIKIKATGEHLNLEAKLDLKPEYCKASERKGRAHTGRKAG